MKASNLIKTLLFVLMFGNYMVKAEFFLKNGQSSSKNIPRMGKKSSFERENIMPHLIHRVAKTLEVLMEVIEAYDVDGNGELSPEELMSVPFIQNAIKNYIEARELQELPREEEMTRQTIEEKE